MATYSMKPKRKQPGMVSTLPKGNVRQDNYNPNRRSTYSMAPKAPAAPAAPKARPASAPAAGIVAAPHALADDAQASAARAQAIFDATQKRASLAATGSYDATDLAEAIRRLQTQRPQDENAAKNAANSQGLASSSTVVNNLNNIATQYTRSEGDARQAYGRRESERAAQLGEVDSQGLLTDAAITAALQERQAQRDAEAASVGALAPPQGTVTPPKAVTTAVSAAEFLKTHRLVGNKWKKVK